MGLERNSRCSLSDSKGSCFRIGNGVSINLWGDPWIEDKVIRPKEGVDQRLWTLVASLWNLSEHRWNQDILNAICDNESVEAILHMEWPQATFTNKLRWLENNKVEFSIKSCYKLSLADRVGVFDPIWSKIWKSNLHKRLKMFLWRVCVKAIPTRDLIADRIGGFERSCVLCDCDNETDVHLFKDCNFARALAF